MLEEGGFKATAKVMFPKLKAKAFVSFVFDEDTFASWPLSIKHVTTDAQVAYGHIR
jgi:kinetochore protein Spc7/SPC105